MKSQSSVSAHSIESTAVDSNKLCGCIIQAWEQHEAELFHFLLSRLNNQDDAQDMLQELFIRLLQQGSDFCTVKQPRAWLYRVARNALTDRRRTQKPFVELPADLPKEDVKRAAIERLDACLWRNLEELNAEDRAIIEQCDLRGMLQKDFAAQNGLSLTAAKARLQRARQKLRAAIAQNCQVRFDETGRVCCHVPR